VYAFCHLTYLVRVSRADGALRARAQAEEARLARVALGLVRHARQVVVPRWTRDAALFAQRRRRGC
jgi:hypothetical protein